MRMFDVEVDSFTFQLLNIQNHLVYVNKVHKNVLSGYVSQSSSSNLKLILGMDNLRRWPFCDEFLHVYCCTFHLTSVYLTLSVLIDDFILMRELTFAGCPSSCECKEFGENQHKKILVTGEDLLTVPSNIPFNTGAVYV